MTRMISISVLTWQKFILLLMLFTSCSGRITYYVTPVPDVPCPGEPCLTLSEYVADRYFQNLTINTTMEFLPGNHSLKQTISVTNMTWLTLHGDSSSLPEVTSRVVCMWPAGFIFTNISELHISALGFLSCGHNDSAAVTMISVQQSDISDCIFQNNTNKKKERGAICYYNSPFNFQNNSQNATHDGGALYIDTSNLTLTGNVFQNNSAICGGALGVWKSNLITTGNTFQNNLANLGNISVDGIGGALSVSHSNLTLTGNAFQNNSVGTAASSTGGDCPCAGALYVQLSYITLTDNLFQNNSAYWGGAAIIMNGTLAFTRNAFQSNSATAAGALHVENSIGSLKNNTVQNNNCSLYGGAISALNSILKFTGNTFQFNFALLAAALIGLGNINLSLIGNTFWKNSGGAIIVTGDGNTLSLTNNTFLSNFANMDSGGAISVTSCNLSVIGNTFWNNSAILGGALDAENSTINLIGNTFQGNFATETGGALYLHASITIFTNNHFTEGYAQLGGAIVADGNGTVTMQGENIIRNNTARYGGGIVSLDSQLGFMGNTIFRNNTAVYGGGLYTYSSVINGKATFISNSATEGGGGVYAARSTLHFKGNTTIMKNSAVDGNGGGLLLSDESKFYLQPDTHVYFISNSAAITGGAIKIAEHNPLTYCIYSAATSFDATSSECFFQIQNQTEDWNYYTATEFKAIIEELNIGIYFDNNSAVEAGADLHGGSVNNCAFDNIVTVSNECTYCPTSGEVFDDITSSGNTPIVSSDPLNICTCKNKLIDCSGSYFPEPVYPGSTLEVPVIAHGQRNGTTSAVVKVVDTPSIFQGTQNTQNVNNNCTTLRYTIHSNSTQNVTLYAEGPCPPTNVNTLKVVLDIVKCPPGFYLSEFQLICVCAERLQRFTNTCQIDYKTVLRPHDADFWAGYDNRIRGLILHPHCPFDYCTSKKIYLSVDDSDKQCNYNRSGLLCGRCSENLSLALGSSHCLRCSNSHLALLPAFVSAGIALVLLLLILRLTVATGTINGLIFYANIVAVNSAIFFQPKVTNVLTVFIAWLNLDLGIETCFYNGMDAYVKTWLQFVFPLYVWALVGLIILGSHFSGRIAKTFGSNPIAVLATLFLLSYAKLLRTAFAALSYTILEYPNHTQIVWLYDGNIGYLSNKHIPLFIFAMVCLIFLFSPYTLLLMFGQWFQVKSMFKIFSWVNSSRIKPFLDAYHGPYTNKHRYWTGVMLLFRFILFLISAFPFNRLGDPSVNLLAIASATTALLTFLAMLGTRVYKNWCLSLIEISFLLNLTILAMATLYIRPSAGGRNQNAATFTSVGIAFMTFIGIIIYHSIQQMKGTWLYKRVSRCVRRNYIPVLANDQYGFRDPPDVVYASGSAPTQTVVDIRDSQLREPCMATN